MNLTLLYRGPLSSCNYGCEYCPFAKRVETHEELAEDRTALARFVDWIAARPAHDRLRVFFTPWGEALVRAWYRDAVVALSHLPQVDKVALQTNLSVPMAWVRKANTHRLGIWATYHPQWSSRATFVSRVVDLHEMDVSVSAGAVGFRRFAGEIEALRAELPPDVYVWINAPKSSEVLDEAEIRRFEQIDPLFRLNTVQHESRGRDCATGATVVSVAGDGTVRRCHFIDQSLGNLYEPELEGRLQSRPCTAATCGCHIGYVHLDYLNLGQIFGSGILERVPDRPPLPVAF